LLPSERKPETLRSSSSFFVEDAFRIIRERDEELALLRQQLHRLAGDTDDPRGEIDVEVAHRLGKVFELRNLESFPQLFASAELLGAGAATLCPIDGLGATDLQ
jgi:hypothetical protein